MHSIQLALDVDGLRTRLRKMSDEELRKFGKAARYMVSPTANTGKPPLPTFVLQLEEARATPRAVSAVYPYYWHNLDTVEISSTCLCSTVIAYALTIAENYPYRLVSIRMYSTCAHLSLLGGFSEPDSEKQTTSRA